MSAAPCTWPMRRCWRPSGPAATARRVPPCASEQLLAEREPPVAVLETGRAEQVGRPGGRADPLTVDLADLDRTFTPGADHVGEGLGPAWIVDAHRERDDVVRAAIEPHQRLALI